LIDDPDDIITTTYTIGDGISDILGILSSFNGQLQFVPEQDPGAASSTGNTINLQSVTLTSLPNNPEDYESELILVSAITVDNSVNTIWIVDTEYPMSNGEGNFVFRTSFFDTDYIDQDVSPDMLNPDYALENLLQLESAAKYTVTLHF